MKFHSQHHSFDIHLAAEYGIEEAILIHHFQHWIRINKKLDKNFHEGRTWTYQTLDEIAAVFPYWTKDEVFNLIERLCKGKGRRSKKDELDFSPVLMKGNFNRSPYDRTVWYAFCDEPKWILPINKIDIGASQNPNRSEPTPIPDTKTDAKEIHDMTHAREAEKKVTPELKDRGSAQERKAFLDMIVFPDQSRISERNKESWCKLYSLWRLKKAGGLFRRMLEAGKEISNPEGMFYTLLKDPDCESTKQIEECRDAVYAFIDQHMESDIWIEGNFVVDYKTKKELSLSMDKNNLLNELKRWINV